MNTRTTSAFNRGFLRSLRNLTFAAGLIVIGRIDAAYAIADPAPDEDAAAVQELTARQQPSATTSTTLPGSCGDGSIDAGEDCEPPQSFCRGGCNPFTGICVDFICGNDCSCPPPLCGDALIDPKENCDPPGSPCERGICNSRCRCRR